MRFTFILIICSLGFKSVLAQATYNLDSTVLTSRTVISGIDIPWEITWGPDDHIWMTERFGRVSRVNPTTGAQEVLLDLSADVFEQSEAGMLGLVLHPDFTNNPYVYIAYTYLSGSNILEKLVRFRYNSDSLIEPFTLVDSITGSTTHIGCRLLITPDNKLLMTTGDARNTSLSQNISSLSGKLLRMNLDGSIPSDNPNPNSLVWSWGHRNAQGLCLAPNGILYSSEHGPTTDDELNILEARRNYGWPDVHGLCDSPPEISFCNDSNVFEPLVVWTPTIAPSDIIWYDHPAIPEWREKLLMTVLKNKQLVAFEFNSVGNAVVNQTSYFTNEFGRLRDICISPDGKIYLATNGTSWTNTNPFTHYIIELSNEDYYTPTGIATSNDFNVKLGPNPLGKGEPLNIHLPSGSKATFTLYSLTGKNMLKKQLGTSNAIPLQLPQGVYIYKLELSNGKANMGSLIIQ